MSSLLKFLGRLLLDCVSIFYQSGGPLKDGSVGGVGSLAVVSFGVFYPVLNWFGHACLIFQWLIPSVMQLLQFKYA